MHRDAADPLEVPTAPIAKNIAIIAQPWLSIRLHIHYTVARNIWKPAPASSCYMMLAFDAEDRGENWLHSPWIPCQYSSTDTSVKAGMLQFTARSQVTAGLPDVQQVLARRVRVELHVSRAEPSLSIDNE